MILTVPASFDEAARELTVDAAKQAGIAQPILLEEPQAAFYCWIVTHQDVWQREVRAGELILVCDIGGGTTDFSLITVVETPSGPGFRRVAVGDHLMLGGDNIDLALAHRVEKKLGAARLDTEQWSALRYSCRIAKEKLLSDLPADRWPVTIAGRGSRIIGGSLQSELTREEVLEIVLGGFFPITPRARGPGPRARRPASRNSASRSSPTRPSPGTSPRSSAATRPRRSAQGGHAGTDDPRPARRDPLQRRGPDARPCSATGSSRSSAPGSPTRTAGRTRPGS